MGRPRPRPRRPGPGRTGHLRGQHRPAHHRPRPRPGRLPAGLGRHRIPDDVRRGAAVRRAHRRPALPQVGVPERGGRVHRRLHRQRFRRRTHRADRGPGSPGSLRRAADPGRAVDHHDHLLRCPAPHRPGSVGGRRVPRRRRGSAARRSPDHLGRLADHLLDQRTHRRHRLPRRPQGHPRRPHRAARLEPVRPGRRRHRHRQPRRAHLRPRRHRTARLALRTSTPLAGRVHAAGNRIRRS